jgi:putative aminopeptidase FrvX
VDRIGGSDADVIFAVKEGIPSVLISLALRYLHSVVEMADLRDLDETIEIIARVVESVTDDDDFGQNL